MPQKRHPSSSCRGRAAAAAVSAAVSVAGAAAALCCSSASAAPLAPQAAAATAEGVRAVLTRGLGSVPAPAGADALRISIFGDGSGGRVQLRLLASGGADPAMDAYYAAPDVPLDFTGWKTVVLPLADFVYRSEESPETDASAGAALAALGTLDTVQIAVTAAPSCKVFFDDLAWTKAGSAPADPPLAVIDDFESAELAPTDPTAWRLGGDYDQIHTAVLTRNRVAAYAKGGQGSLQLDLRTPGLQERQLYAPALKARLKKTPTLPYAVFVRPTFQAIRPDSTPSPQELAQPAQLSLFACAGQTEPISFAVYSAADLKNATVQVVGPLPSQSRQSSLPSTAIDVRVVRLGDGTPRPDPAAPLPELLMKDDRDALDGPLPSVRLTGSPSTDIPAGTSKQFWVTVNVPKDQFAAIYTGKLVFSAPGFKPTGIPLRVEVLPMRLKTAFLQYGIDLHSRLSPEGARPDDAVVTPDTYAAELADVRDHGFRIVTIDEPVANLGQAMQLYKAAGLSPVGPVVLADPPRTKEEVQQVDALRDSLGLGNDFDFYYQLPPDLMAQSISAPAAPMPAEGGSGGKRPLTPLQSYLKMLQVARKPPLIIAPCDSRAAYGALSPDLNSDRLAPVFAATSDYATTLVATGRREITNRDYWSWDIARQSPARNRMLAGLLLCRTGMNSSPLYGAFPGPYQTAAAGVAAAPAPAAVAPTAPAAASPAAPPASPAPAGGGASGTGTPSGGAASAPAATPGGALVPATGTAPPLTGAGQGGSEDGTTNTAPAAPAPIPAAAPTAGGGSAAPSSVPGTVAGAPPAAAPSTTAATPAVAATPQLSPAAAPAVPSPAAAAPTATAPAATMTIGGEHVAYLVNGGVIDTIQWEAVRAGVDDVRYYGTLKGYVRDLKDAKLRKDATDRADVYLGNVMRKSFRTLSPAEYQALRRGFADWSLGLLKILRSSIGGYPG